MDYNGQMVAAMLCGVKNCPNLRCMALGTSAPEMSAAAMPYGWSKRHDGDGQWRWYCPVHAAAQRIELDECTIKK